VLQLDLAGIAHAIGGHLIGNGGGEIQRVVTDSRAVQAGDLFVALDGARTDGHQYLAQVKAAGAAGALVMPDRGDRPADLPCVVVSDTLQALGALARFHLGRLNANVVGITGTVGKTTAKDLLAHLLGGEEHKVHAAPASYNSECGLPLAILGADLDTRLLVLEYGINAPGEMRRLLQIAQPHWAWITALTPVHLEGMGDLQTIVDEKLLLAEATRSGGAVWMPEAVADLAQLKQSSWQARAESVVIEKVLRSVPGDYRLRLAGIGEVQMPLEADHEAIQVAVASHAALTLGVPGPIVAQRLSTMPRPNGRLTRYQFGDVLVLDDAYNASPAAVTAALQVMARLDRPGRRIAVLGTMHEMGATAEHFHRVAGEQAAAGDVDWLIGVGSGGRWIADSATSAGLRSDAVADATAATELLQQHLKANDVILLKASRAEGLERMLPLLKQTAFEMAGSANSVTSGGVG
jgi:UDP-N-acetylmuramoyl-tripeptide--D-alanyl-D-alanine ligase